MLLPLSSVKIGTCAKISSFKVTDNYSKRICEKLNTVGFIKNREIKVLNKNSSMYIAQIERENPFCFNKDVADVIIVESDNIQECNFLQKLLGKIFQT